jgi:hypothetical protein
MIRIADAVTNEVIDREMNDEEFAQYQADVAEEKAYISAQKAKADEKTALLEKLGISSEEAKLLLG